MRIRLHRTIEFNRNIDTEHIRTERAARVLLVEKLMAEEKAVIVKTFWVDKGHRKGAELHNLYSDGIVRVYNEKSGKHVTDLIARVGQVYRYYEAINMEAPKEIIRFARNHQNRGLHHM